MPGFRKQDHDELRESEKGGSHAPVPEAPTRPGECRWPSPGHTDFTLALYAQLRQIPGNLFFSPFSIRTALGMAYAGARGETAEQMREALRVESSDEALHEDLAETIHRLNAAGGADYDLSVANSLWSQESETLQAPFLDLVARHYGGNLNVVDFRSDPEAARVAINQWVEENTSQKIRELIPPGGLDVDTLLVLANAVYFKGLWLLPFSKAATRDEPFFLEDGNMVPVPLMYRKVEFRYLKADGYQAMDLEYRGGDLSMLVVLPDRKNGLRDLEKRLSAQLLHDCVANMREREVKLFLPRFRMTWEIELGSYLGALGMPLAFTRFRADFSGINGCEPPHEESLFVSAVLHKAFVEMNEEGTEAAALTMYDMLLSSADPLAEPPPIPVFRADHPFLFAIRDRKSGAILFLGRVTDPTQEN